MKNHPSFYEFGRFGSLVLDSRLGWSLIRKLRTTKRKQTILLATMNVLMLTLTDGKRLTFQERERCFGLVNRKNFKKQWFEVLLHWECDKMQINIQEKTRRIHTKRLSIVSLSKAFTIICNFRLCGIYFRKVEADTAAGGLIYPGGETAFKALLSARFCAAIWSHISDCDETYNYWEPMHFLGLNICWLTTW